MQDQRLKPCPFCGGVCQTIQGEASGDVWAHGKFWRVYCTKCQVRQLFHRSEEAAIGAWNRRMEELDTKANMTNNAEFITAVDFTDEHKEYTLEEVLGGAVLREWVQWVTVDADGEVWGYKETPERGNHYWMNVSDCRSTPLNRVVPPQNFENLIWRVKND